MARKILLIPFVIIVLALISIFFLDSDNTKAVKTADEGSCIKEIAGCAKDGKCGIQKVNLC